MLARAREAGLAAAGAFVAITALAAVGLWVGQPLLIAPFGASATLLFGAPASPLAQPRNVVGGHLVASVCGLAVLSALGPGSVPLGAGVALAVAAMLLTRTVHPPAGADPIVIILGHAGWGFLLLPILPGAIALVLVAVGFHRVVTRRAYPVT